MNLLPARRPTPPDETNPQHQEPHRQQKPGHECKVDQRVWLCGPMSFSFSLRRSISLLRRSFLASSSESAIRYSTSSLCGGRPRSLRVIMLYGRSSGANSAEFYFHALG